MFNFSYTLWQLIPAVLQGVIGIVAIVIVLMRWKSQPDKGLMLAAIATGFIFVPVLSLCSTALMFLSYGPGGFYDSNYEFMEWLFQLLFLAAQYAPVFSIGAILAYILLKSKESSATSQTEIYSQTLTGQVAGEDPSVVMAEFAHGGNWGRGYPPRAWTTDIVDPNIRINILRKREWAFLADVLPAIVFNIIGTWIISKDSSGFQPRPMSTLILAVMWLVFLGLLIYILAKDSFNGVSLGKRITGCRIVKMSDGTPIGIGESIVRNLVFLIPLMPLVELAVASLRADRRRLGDLLARTTAVTGEPDKIFGVENEEKEKDEAKTNPPTPHPLDD